jgi:NAD(P)-dependent dehydrogenase (short-subunit alcohol dehydrogenase family)
MRPPTASRGPCYSVSESPSPWYATQGLRDGHVASAHRDANVARRRWLARQIAATTSRSADDIAGEPASSLPIGWVLRSEEIGDTICILASALASGIAGTEVVVEGGLVSTR